MITATIALTSLIVDPLRKVVFVLRCFKGEALNNGEDLLADLRQARAGAARTLAIAAMALFAAISPLTGYAQSVERGNSADPSELEQRITEVLEKREYSWRAPREKDVADEEEKSWLGKWVGDAGESIGRYVSAAYRSVGRAFRWVVNQFNPPTVPTPNTGSLDWAGLGKALLVILIIALLGLLGWLLVRLLKGSKKPAVAVAQAMPVPDLLSENIVADQLPEDGWLQLAREHASRGELSLALRAAWLAGLAHLGERELIRIARHKSNRDYERELRRRARDRAELVDAFDANLRSFERVWYGKHDVSPDGYREFEENHEQIRKS